MKSKQKSRVCVHLHDKENPYYFPPERQKSTPDSFNLMQLERITLVKE